MKSKAKQKTFINNMITYAIVVVAYIVVQILMGTGHMSSLMKGLLVPFCIYVIMAVSLNLTVGILGELSLGHAGFYVRRRFRRSVVLQVHEGLYESDGFSDHCSNHRSGSSSCFRYSHRYPGTPIKR